MFRVSSDLPRRPRSNWPRIGAYVAYVIFLLVAGLALTTLIWFSGAGLAEDLRRQQQGWLARGLTVGLILAAVAPLAAVAWRRHAAAEPVLHDPLTGLPNRMLFQDRLIQALARADRRANPLALLLLEIDDFAQVRARVGRRAADHLLVAVAARLRASLRPGDTVARVEPQRFAVVIEDLLAPADAAELARRVVSHLAAPHRVGCQEITLNSHVGVVISPTGHEPPETLLRDAYDALARAQRQGPAEACFILTDRRPQPSWSHLPLASELRHALHNDELRVVYQPIIELATGRVRALEALVRWQHPRYGLLTPDNFLPLAEESGLIVPLGQWLLATAARQVRLWQDQYPGQPPLGLNLNLSARQWQQARLAAELQRLLTEGGLPASCLTVEIPAALALNDRGTTRETLQALKAVGVQVQIVVGEGLPLSLAAGTPMRPPFDELKLDRAFTLGLGPDPDEATRRRGWLSWAQKRGLMVAVGGIETAEQLQEWRALKCHLGQGYYFARPLPPEGITSLLSVARGGQSVASP